MALTAENSNGTVVPVRCDHGHLLAVVEPDGTVVVVHKDGCSVRIPPPERTIIVQQTVLSN